MLRRLSRLPKSIRSKKCNKIEPNFCSHLCKDHYSVKITPQFAYDSSLPFEEQLLRLERRQVEDSVARYISAITLSDDQSSRGLDLVNPGFEWGTPHVCSTPISARSGRCEGLDNSLNEALERSGSNCWLTWTNTRSRFCWFDEVFIYCEKVRGFEGLIFSCTIQEIFQFI